MFLLTIKGEFKNQENTCGRGIPGRRLPDGSKVVAVAGDESALPPDNILAILNGIFLKQGTGEPLLFTIDPNERTITVQGAAESLNNDEES